MKEYVVNNLNNFIGGWYMDDDTLMDDIIQYHKTNPEKGDGVSISLSTGEPTVDKTKKNSVDCFLDSNVELSNRYHKQLQSVLDLYIEKYKFCNYYSRFANKDYTNIQYYPPNGGYYIWHTERGNSYPPVSNRHLTFMTYLNDVDDGGETEFYYQELKVKPEKGLTLIWGSDWTFTHRGLPSPTQEKYIVTGWFHFY